MALTKSSQKEEMHSKIIHEYALNPRTRAVILIDLIDSETIQFLLDAGEDIGIACVDISRLNNSLTAGFDAFVSDGKSGRIDIVGAVKSGVVPILPLQNDFPKTFQEFDPMKFEGNAFLFATSNKYLIFEKLIRYLENIKYPGDKRTLLANVGKTF